MAVDPFINQCQFFVLWDTHVLWEICRLLPASPAVTELKTKEFVYQMELTAWMSVDEYRLKKCPIVGL